MKCVHCAAERVKRFGKDRKGNQRHRCLACGKTFLTPHTKPLGEMQLPLDKAEMALRLLLEGTSIRSTERITGVARNTLCKLVATVGNLCEQFMRKLMCRLHVAEVEVDELWGFVAMKEKTRKREHPQRFDYGDAWCYLGIDRKTRLILAWHVGKRNEPDTFAFAIKLHRATSGRFQLSTDGYPGYQLAIPSVFRGIEWGVIVKIFGAPPEPEQRRYSPADIIGVKRMAMMGRPTESRICTSHAERVNLTLRMGIRRLTRLTNGFSKKWSNHEAAHSLFFAAYNFVRVHATLKQTPAMAAGLTDHPWTVRELLEQGAALAA